jgi:hypothetical protein
MIPAKDLFVSEGTHIRKATNSKREGRKLKPSPLLQLLIDLWRKKKANHFSASVVDLILWEAHR